VQLRTPLILTGLIALLAIALLALLLGIALPDQTIWPASFPLHLVFALGVMPLILGAMIWFTPVLTRTGTPQGLALAPPVLGMLAGLVLLFSLLFDFRIYLLAALLALLATSLLSWWMQQRVAQTLGAPHPGLLWYRLAVGALAAGLTAIALGAFWPEQWIALKRLHLHLNTLGFIGLTALGTLRVLLPTAGGFTDARAIPWLQSSWRWLITGTLLTAMGSAWSPALATVGLLLWLPPLLQLLHHTIRLNCHRICTLHGAAPALAGAVIGLLLSLLGGALHGLGLLAAQQTTLCFIMAFLLPLVTGAATQLLPLWMVSAHERGRQQRMGQRLGRFGALRALLFIAAGVLTQAGMDGAWPIAALGLVHFLAMILSSLFQHSDVNTSI